MSRIFLKLAAVIGMAILPSMLSAQPVTIRIFDWNVLSFEGDDNSNTNFNIDLYVQKIIDNKADVVCFNEFETASDRVQKEKLSEVAARLGMYVYFVESYPKAGGYYGNCILSRFPIINTASTLHEYKHIKGPGNYQFNDGDFAIKYGTDQRSMGYADIAVPTGNGNDFRIVRIAVSHFEAFPRGTTTNEVRRKQAEAACEYLHLDNPEYPTVLAGDLNTADLEYQLKSLADKGDHVFCNWVDHIFVFPKGAWTSTDSQKLWAGTLSDHDAIFSVLTLK